MEIKDVMIHRKNFFDQPVKKNLRTYDNIRKIATGQGDDCTTSCQLDYNYSQLNKLKSGIKTGTEVIFKCCW